MIKLLTMIVVLFLVQFPNAQTLMEDVNKDNARSTLRFDSVSYVNNRMNAIKGHFWARLSNISIDRDARSLFRNGDPQTFWKYLYTEYRVQEVYFSLETSEVDTSRWVGSVEHLLKTGDVIFRSDSCYYWVHYSVSLYNDSSDNIQDQPSNDKSKLIRAERLSEDQVLAFLARIDTLYRTSSMQSHDVFNRQWEASMYRPDDPIYGHRKLISLRDTSCVILWADTLEGLTEFPYIRDTAGILLWIGSTEKLDSARDSGCFFNILNSEDFQMFDSIEELLHHLDSIPTHIQDYSVWNPANPMYAFMEIPGVNYLGYTGPILLFNFSTAPEFNSFYELSYFYDRIKLLQYQYDPERSDEIGYLEKWADSVQAHYGNGRQVVDSILQFWPPEVRPNLDSLFIPDMSETEN